MFHNRGRDIVIFLYDGLALVCGQKISIAVIPEAVQLVAVVRFSKRRAGRRRNVTEFPFETAIDLLKGGRGYIGIREMLLPSNAEFLGKKLSGFSLIFQDCRIKVYHQGKIVIHEEDWHACFSFSHASELPPPRKLQPPPYW